jgi:hypothetical protein
MDQRNCFGWLIVVGNIDIIRVFVTIVHNGIEISGMETVVVHRVDIFGVVCYASFCVVSRLFLDL